MRLLLLDNYDSFTYNVYQYLMSLGHNVIVCRNDKITISQIEALNIDAIIISPGPCTPDDAGICLQAIEEFAGKIAFFGICLGHQAIGQAFGGKVVNANELFHGKTSVIKPLNKGVMTRFKESFIATRYHSLVVEMESLPDCFDITCELENGQLMGMIHREYNIESVQFHPESILTDVGYEILREFLNRTERIIGQREETSNNIDRLMYPKFDSKNIQITDKLNAKQFIINIPGTNDSYQIFKAIYGTFGHSNCAFLESASGPDIDCKRSFIFLNPIFEFKLKRSKFSIYSSNERISCMMDKLLNKFYQKKTDYYYIGNDTFADIFSILRESISLEIKHNEKLAFSNGLVGYFGYEYLHYLENIPRVSMDPLNMPEVHLKYFTTIIEVASNKEYVRIITNNFEEEKSSNLNELLDIVGKEVKDKFKISSHGKMRGAAIPSESNISKEMFIKNGGKAKKYIYDGDIFQVQLGQRQVIEKDIDPLALYENLRNINPSPYMFYWDNGDYQLISNSPELQIRVENSTCIIRPIAGTSKGKGKNKSERESIKENFKNDEKERAEHVMLVDLARNDIGRMAIPGSVKVDNLLSLEEYSHVFHLTSTVSADVYNDLNSMALFESTFPAGTLTGAPKVRAMEIIAELESEIRGPYGGAFGVFDFNGNIASSIIIRTVLRRDEKLYLQACAGFVADSIPQNEWDEISFKLNAVKQAIIATPEKQK